jgi:signal transduction histidine kinase
VSRPPGRGTIAATEQFFCGGDESFTKAEPVPRATLLVIQGPEQGARFELADDEVGLGRGVTNAVQLHDTEVSRSHCRFSFRDGIYSITDNRSANGTLVNGREVTTCQLVSGDHIQVGRTVLLYTEAVTPSPSVRDHVALSPRGSLEEASNIVSAAPVADEDDALLAPHPEASTPELQRAVAHLQTLYRIADETVRPSLSLEALLSRILDQVIEATGADRGCMLLCDPGETLKSHDAAAVTLKPAAFRDRRPGAAERLSVSRTIVDYVLQKRTGVRTTNAQADQRFIPGNSILQTGIREAMCVPMQGRNELVGVLYVDTFTPPEKVLRAAQPVSHFDEGQLRLLVAVGRQAALVVEDDRYQQALIKAERLAAVGQTIATLSHHIKNILQGVRGGSYLIDMGLSEHNEDLVRKGWAIVDKNQGRIYNLVMDMLTYSKERQPAMTSSDLNAVAGDVVELLQSRAREIGCQLTFEPQSGIPASVFDAEGIHRAVLNVAANALDAVEGAESPAVSIRTQFDPGGALCVTITDNGPGIEPERLQQIFNLFESTKGARGTGIGLAVSQKILREHGGAIQVDSTPGRGAKFTLAWPALDDSAVQKTQA